MVSGRKPNAVRRWSPTSRSRVEDTLPGASGGLFAYLVLNRGRPVPRDTYSWPAGEKTPLQRRETRERLLSSCGTAWRRTSPRADRDQNCSSRSDLRRRRAALEGVPPGGVRHRGRTGGRQAWGPAGIAYHVATSRSHGLEAPWIDDGDVAARSGQGCRRLECFAAASSASAVRRWRKPRNAPEC